MKCQALCAHPLVMIIDNFLAKEECEYVIQRGADTQERGVSLADGKFGVSDARTNSEAKLDQWTDPRLSRLIESISDVVRLPPENCEQMRVLRYREGEQFVAHRDGFAAVSPIDLEKHAQGGQRLFTALCYLNDVSSGGETEFPKLKIAIRPKRGRLLVFANTMAGSDEIHSHSDHAGLPTASGEKWVASTFWRQHMWHIPREYPPAIGSVNIY